MIRILDEVKDANSIAISGHIRPDGDCVGSCLAMYLFLKKARPDAKVHVYMEQPSEVFNILKGIEDIKRPDGTQHAYDVLIVQDCNIERLGDGAPMAKGAKKVINIDHHISNPGEGDVNYIVPEASSASELVYDVIDKELIDEDIAKAIYVGIIHDTGILQYSNTSPKTLNIVARLIEFGFDFPKIIDETFYEKSYVQNKLLGKALTDSELLLNSRAIASHITAETLKEYNATSKEMDGIVNQLRYTKGVDIGIFMYEIKPGSYKISMRTNGVIDCSKVSTAFGGGGHVRASGCNLDGTYEEILDKLILEISKQIND